MRKKGSQQKVLKVDVIPSELTALEGGEEPFPLQKAPIQKAPRSVQNPATSASASAESGAGVPSLHDPMQVYLQEISRFPVLSREEEDKLSKAFYTSRDPRLAQQLAQANLRFVVKIAAEYTRFGAKLIDLVQEGNTGLLHAIKKFNPYKGVCLITYAVWWIKGYIQEYLLRQYSLVRLGGNAKQRKLFYLLRREQEKLQQLPFTGDTPPLLAPPPGFKEEEAQSMRHRLKERDVSLDQFVADGSSTRLIDVQAEYKENSVEDELNLFQEKAFMRKSIAQILPTLNQKERFILEHRLLSEQALTLNEIGSRFSITREAVRQAENRLIKKIKKQMEAKAQLPKG